MRVCTICNYGCNSPVNSHCVCCKNPMTPGGPRCSGCTAAEERKHGSISHFKCGGCENRRAKTWWCDSLKCGVRKCGVDVAKKGTDNTVMVCTSGIYSMDAKVAWNLPVDQYANYMMKAQVYIDLSGVTRIDVDMDGFTPFVTGAKMYVTLGEDATIYECTFVTPSQLTYTRKEEKMQKYSNQLGVIESYKAHCDDLADMLYEAMTCPVVSTAALRWREKERERRTGDKRREITAKIVALQKELGAL